MKNQVSKMTLLAGIILAGLLAVAVPAYAHCGWCGDHINGDSQASDWSYGCGYCDSHPDHECPMTADDWDALLDNFICQVTDEDGEHDCSLSCRIHDLSEAVRSCPSYIDSPDYECNIDCLAGYLIDSGYVDEEYFDNHTICYRCVMDFAENYDEYCDSGYQDAQAHSCCCCRGGDQSTDGQE
jgi:hypothetical protein